MADVEGTAFFNAAYTVKLIDVYVVLRMVLIILTITFKVNHIEQIIMLSSSAQVIQSIARLVHLLRGVVKGCLFIFELYVILRLVICIATQSLVAVV